MIIDSPASLKLLSSLSEIGGAGATREHLLQKADISTSTFYRQIGALIENGLVKAAGGRYSLALDGLYGYRFKLWHDVERLYRLLPEDRDMVLGVMSTMTAQARNKIKCLWLVGSAARGELQRESDLDFLLVTDGAQDPINAGTQRRPHRGDSSPGACRRRGISVRTFRRW